MGKNKNKEKTLLLNISYNDLRFSSRAGRYVIPSVYYIHKIEELPTYDPAVSFPRIKIQNTYIPISTTSPILIGQRVSIIRKFKPLIDQLLMFTRLQTVDNILLIIDSDWEYVFRQYEFPEEIKIAVPDRPYIKDGLMYYELIRIIETL